MGMHHFRSHTAQQPPQGDGGPRIQHWIDLPHQRWDLEHRHAGLAELLQIDFQQRGIVRGLCLWVSKRETDAEPDPIMPEHRLESLPRRPALIESCDDMEDGTTGIYVAAFFHQTSLPKSRDHISNSVPDRLRRERFKTGMARSVDPLTGRAARF